MTVYVNMDDKPVKDRIFLSQRIINCMKMNPLDGNLESSGG
jgi:hypothetical protein